MRKTTLAIATVALAAAGGATAALASDREGHRQEHEEHEDQEARGKGRGRGEREGRAPVPVDAAARALYRKECGACHLDFPPGLLPAASHRRVMAGLERHFGQNAELDPDDRARIERWLVENAAEAGARLGRKALASIRGPPPLRITEVPWFQRKHRRVDARVAARPSVRSLANCGACHPRAGDWDFDDDRVKIPGS
jgi:hypothetical protein